MVGANIETVLDQLADLARSLGDRQALDDAGAVLERVRRNEFIVACVGQFKRGKSTLINALLCDAILPAGVLPVTSVPTLITYGERRARVRLANDAWRSIPIDAIADYVTEERNPGNSKEVRALEVTVPSPLLADGLCLVDTPGLGSVSDENSAAVRAFLPHIDVAVVVTGADPPLTGDELRLITDLSQQVDHIFLVLNKADRVDADDRCAAREFACTAIQRHSGHAVTAFEVSARDQLAGEARWPDWQRLVDALFTVRRSSRRHIAVQSGIRSAERLTRHLLGEVTTRRRLLTDPIESARERVQRFRDTVALAERHLADLAPLLNAEGERLATQFAAAAESFKERQRHDAHKGLDDRLDRIRSWHGPSVRRHSFAAAQDVAREIASDWIATARRELETLFPTGMRRFADAALDLWRSLRIVDTADDWLPELPTGAELALRLGSESAFVFNEQITRAQPASPLRFTADLALGVLGFRRVIVKDAHAFLDWLIDLNVSRAQSDLLERIQRSRAELERLLRATLTEALRRATESLERAEDLRRQGAAAVAGELRQLSEAQQSLERLAASELS